MNRESAEKKPRKFKSPHRYTLEEIGKISDKQFPPPWSIIEAITNLATYVKSYQEKTAK